MRVHPAHTATLAPALVALLLTACEPSEPMSTGPAPEATPATNPTPSGPLFVDRAAESGLDFVHFNGMTGEFYYSEHMGGGVALLDYDRDGDLDLYITQGHLLGDGVDPEKAIFPTPESAIPGGPLVDRLYRNDLDAEGNLRFTDVTAESGLRVDGYAMAAVSADYDNDGWPDLYVTHWEGANRLLRNAGDGTFEDVTERAGVGDRRWSTAAVFFDADRDGLLDLYVGNYLDFTFALHKDCQGDIGLRDYCGPLSFEPVPDVLYRNRGDGTFEEATSDFGLDHAAAPVLGAVVGDWNADGYTDLYLANDEFPNNLLIAEHTETGIRYRDQARLSGAAMNAEGHAEAGMGVDVGDFDRDGDEDLFVSHLTQETNTLYENQGDALFADRTSASGLGVPSFDATGFGAGFLDYDNDGWLDIFVANGAVQGIRELVAAGATFPMHQPNQLFHNLGNGRFEEVSDSAGEVFSLSEVSRGAGFGDIDNDGDTDIVVHNNAGPVRLMINQVGQDRSWIGFRLIDPTHGSRDALGARVEILDSSGGPARIRRARVDGSYASSNDPRVLFGLDGHRGPVDIRITWPDGSVEERSGLGIGRYHQLGPGDSP